MLTADRQAFDAARAGSHTITPVLSDITAAAVIEPVLAGEGAPRSMPTPRVWASGTSGMALRRDAAGTGAELRAFDAGTAGPAPEDAPSAEGSPAGRQPTPAATRPAPMPTSAPGQAVRARPGGVTQATPASATRASRTQRGAARVVDHSSPTIDRSMTTLATTQRAAIEGVLATRGRLDLVRRPRDAGASTLEAEAEPGEVTLRDPMSTPTAPGTPPRLSVETGASTPARRAVLGPAHEWAGIPSPGTQDSVDPGSVASTPGAPLTVTDRPLEAVWSPRRRATRLPGTAEATSARSPADSASGAAAAHSPTVMPPIVARRAGRRVQRDSMDAARTAESNADQTTTGARAGAPVPSADAPVRIDRSSSGAAAASDLRANAFTSGDTIVLPASHGPLDSGRGRSLLAHELVHVGQQRRLGTALPPESSAAGRQLEQEARSAEHLVETSAAARMPTHPEVASPAAGLPLARAARPATQAASTRDGGSNVEVQRAVGGALTLTSRGVGHAGARETTSLASGAPGMAADGDDHIIGTQRASVDHAPAGSQAPGGAPGQDDQELDDLARQLYDRIRFRLSRELLLDRERSGLLNGSR